MHGGVGLIVPVRRRAEGTAVLKVSFPHPGNVHEPDAFAAWGGHGAVLLHERDDERFAMLLERVRAANLAEVEDGDEVVTVAGRMSRRLAIPAPPGLPWLRERADAWVVQLPEGVRGRSRLRRRHAAQVARVDALRSGRLAQGCAPHRGRLRRGRGGRSRTRAAVGTVPCRPGCVLGPLPRIPDRPQWITSGQAHRFRRPLGGVAHRACLGGRFSHTLHTCSRSRPRSRRPWASRPSTGEVLRRRPTGGARRRTGHSLRARTALVPRVVWCPP